MSSSASRHLPRIRPLLPLDPLTCSHINDRALSSNSANAAMQPLKIGSTPFPTLPSAHRISLQTDLYKKENEHPIALPTTTKRSRALHLSGGAFLYQRAFHHEPYPIATNRSGSISPSPTELWLPPFASANCEPEPIRTLTFHDSPTFWLAMYFCFNLGLTLYNKGVLVHFPFPYTLSALHSFFGTIGGYILSKNGYFVPSRLDPSATIVLVAFSALYAVNIAISNVSLQLVTVPFHQVVRAATPIFTLVFSAVLLGRSSSRWKKLSLLPVVAGVGLATFGDYYFTYAGFILTLFGAVLAALKTIYTNVLQTPASQTSLPRPTFTSPLDLIYLLSPIACVQCLCLAQVTGELSQIVNYSFSPLKLIALLLNGCLAFGLNVVSFSANRRVGAVGMTVAANVKQVLTIVFAVLLFNLTITWLNAFGIALTLAGGAWYTYVEYAEKHQRC